MGRVMRTGEVVFLPDVRADPDYLSADPRIHAEISAPLKVGLADRCGARRGGRSRWARFVVILAGGGLDEATKIAEEIRDRFAAGAIPSPDGSRVSATVSAGCAAMGADLGTLSELLSRADMALAIAKHGGRNRVVAA